MKTKIFTTVLTILILFFNNVFASDLEANKATKVYTFSPFINGKLNKKYKIKNVYQNDNTINCMDSILNPVDINFI